MELACQHQFVVPPSPRATPLGHRFRSCLTLRAALTSMSTHVRENSTSLRGIAIRYATTSDLATVGDHRTLPSSTGRKLASTLAITPLLSATVTCLTRPAMFLRLK